MIDDWGNYIRTSLHAQHYFATARKKDLANVYRQLVEDDRID